MIATLLMWRIVVVAIDTHASEQFDDLLLGFNGEVERTLTAYESLLRGSKALVQARRQGLDREEFHEYLTAVEITDRYPGLQGVGYSKLFEPSQLPSVTAQVQAEGFPNFEVKPQGERSVYSAIIFLEPFDARNKRAFGYDMYSEPTRRAAMDRARDTGLPTASNPVELLQETTTDIQSGFLFYLPVYDAKSLPSSQEERQQFIRGFVYSPIRVGDFVNAILERERMPVREQALIRITSDTATGQPAEIYRKSTPAGAPLHTSKFKTRSTTIYYGVPWTIELSSTLTFEHTVNYRLAWLLLACGSGLSILLAGLVGSAAVRQDQMRQSNERMSLLTRELTHRVKNTLAVVQSIAGRSLVEGRSLEDARQVFTDRLHALARAHSHLVDSAWQGASMGSLVREELEPFGARATVSGPEIKLGANSAQTFALVIHELATNATKHGALSVAEGRLLIRWFIKSDDQYGQTVKFTWRESGGPPAREPEPGQRGFGQILLRQPLTHGTSSKPQTTYGENGLVYEFEAPLLALSASNTPEAV